MDPVGQEKEVKKGEGVPFFPHHVLKEGVVIFLLLGVLITLSILVPFELGEKADPLKTPEGIKPEWYFMSMYQVIKYFPKLMGILVVGLAPLLLFLWPFMDKSPWRHPLKRPISILVGVLTVLSLLFFGVLGTLSESKQTFFGKTYEFNIFGVPHLINNAGSDGNLERKQG
jgi:quinol-cytochrome oxidoreductase complex cytochrome b subunit